MLRRRALLLAAASTGRGSLLRLRRGNGTTSSDRDRDRRLPSIRDRIWYVQVGALVCGHVAGLILAHDRALVTFKESRIATRPQYWMLAVMIAFTSLGLWLLSSANS